MDSSIKNLFHDAILAETLRRFNISPEQVEPLDAFESFIYAFTRDGTQGILRIGHDSRRPGPLIHGEVEWINYLDEGGAPVARALMSATGELVEEVEDGQGGHFVATTFQRAPGGPLRMRDWDEPFFTRYGRLVGRMNHLARDFRAAWPRPHWDDPVMLFGDWMLPPGEEIARERYLALLDHLRGLPRDNPAEYGMIHQDAHGGNFFVDERGTLTLFDFDDCCYSWYMNDIAIVLFYAVLFQPDPVGFTRRFMTHFLRGYRQECTLDPAWLGEIPNFLKLREIDLYAVIHRDFDVNNLTDAWVSGFMQGRKQRIEGGVPVVDFDFPSLAEDI